MMVAVSKTDELPPPYTPSDFSSDTQDAQPGPSSATRIPPSPPPTNFLSISRTNAPIKGIYALDPSLPLLSDAPPATDADGRPLNLRLKSTNGSIEVVTTILRAPDIKGAVLLEFTTTNGKVKVNIEDPQQQHFRVRAASTNGSVILRIPPTFLGPISVKNTNGRLDISPAVHAQLTTLFEDRSERKFFLGNYRESGMLNDQSWLGDAARIEAFNGLVEIGFIGEPEKDSRSFWSFFF